MKNTSNNQQNDTRRQSNKRSTRKPALPAYKRGPFSWLIVAIIIFTAMMMLQQGLVTNTLRWDEFTQYLEEGGQIDRIDIGETEIAGKFKEGSRAAQDRKGVLAFKVNYRPDGGAKERLNEIMTNAFAKVYENAKSQKVDMRTGAYMVALKDVARAMQLRGVYP